MYLYKHPNSVYYTRICTPKKLVQLGFPFDFKISLRTKNRPDAVRRNLIFAPIVIQSLDKWKGIETFTQDVINDCKASLFHSIEHAWSSIETGQSFSTTLYTQPPKKLVKHSSPKKAPLQSWLAEFIHSKKQQNITALTVHQLNQRISHFIAFYDNQPSSTMSSASLMSYVDYLHSQKTKPKN